MDAATQAAPPRAATEAEPVSLASDYFQQIMPDAPVVCGRQFLPLSIGRYRRMRREKVAFVAEESLTPTAGDLLKGVIICSMTCAEYDAFLASKDFSRQLKRFAQKSGFLPPRYLDWPILGRIIKWLVGPEVARERDVLQAAYLVEQMRAFQEYIVAGQKHPSYWDESEDSRVSAAHWSHSVESVLREKQGWTKPEVEEEPLTKALWDYFKSMETAGMIRLMTDAEQAFMDKPLTEAEQQESREALEKLWRYKFGDTPMPTADNLYPLNG